MLMNVFKDGTTVVVILNVLTLLEVFCASVTLDIHAQEVVAQVSSTLRNSARLFIFYDRLIATH